MDDISYKDLLELINILVKPHALAKVNDIRDAFENNIKQLSGSKFETIFNFELLKIECKLRDDNVIDMCWKYVCLCMETLLLVTKRLLENPDELLSVSQQKSVKKILEFIVSLGLLPYLLPGVGFALNQKCPTASLYKDSIVISSVTDVDKYKRLCTTCMAIFNICEEKSINGLFLTSHMVDLFASLCQLTMPQFKDPTPDLLSERDYFNMEFKKLLSTSYQPLVINALMVLQGNKKSPRWLQLGVSKLLTERLMGKHGVQSLIRAIQHSADYENPNVVTRLESIARLIITPLVKDKSSYYNIVMPQVNELIYSDDVNLNRIGVLCGRLLYKTDMFIFKQYLSTVLMDPLINFSEDTSEDSITKCINSLHTCFAISSGEMWSVPIEPLVPLSKVIYSIYCKICDSVSLIKKPIEELFWAILSKADDENLDKIFKSVLLNEEFNIINNLPDEINFVYGDEGGIKIKIGGIDADEKIEYSKCVLKLLTEKDVSGKISKKLFLILLKRCCEFTEEISEMKLYVVELLADLAEMEQVQKTLSDDLQSIIEFIELLIKNNLHSNSNDSELLCIALVLLITIMNDMISSKKSDWNKFNNLMPLMPKLSLHSKSMELKLLCDQVYNMMLTHGVIKGVATNATNHPNFNKSKVNKPISVVKSPCEIALEEACDPLIPVRGHAMMELSKLISVGDPEATSKKNVILCIFQENLKNEDSYLYLSAIEGMASLASEFPDTVLIALTEEYLRTETSVRLKVGEALMRVVRRLGEMIPVYKTELLNCFLTGVRDPDNLVRASSLSNIGDLCQLLSYRIGSIAAEILNCVECIVATDRSPEPRRAAVMLLTLILRGLNKDGLNVLESVLVPLYRTLKKIYQTDKDDVVRLHAQLAIEELNNSTLCFLFPKTNLSKRIFVLDPPS